MRTACAISHISNPSAEYDCAPLPLSQDYTNKTYYVNRFYFFSAGIGNFVGLRADALRFPPDAF